MAKSVTELLEHVFSTPNPTTGTLPPEHVAWAVFAHGTVFYSGPSDDLPVDATFDAIAKAACAALEELGSPLAGTESADFNPRRLDAWFPNDPAVDYLRPPFRRGLTAPRHLTSVRRTRII